MVASGQFDYELTDDFCADCDWAAAPVEAYRLTPMERPPWPRSGRGPRGRLAVAFRGHP